MTSQASQPSASISAREVGSTGAMPKRSAQCLRRANSVGRASSGDTGVKPADPDIGAVDSTDGGDSPSSSGTASGTVSGTARHGPAAFSAASVCGMLPLVGTEQRQYPRLGLGLPVTLVFL